MIRNFDHASDKDTAAEIMALRGYTLPASIPKTGFISSFDETDWCVGWLNQAECNVIIVDGIYTRPGNKELSNKALNEVVEAMENHFETNHSKVICWTKHPKIVKILEKKNYILDLQCLASKKY